MNEETRKHAIQYLEEALEAFHMAEDLLQEDIEFNFNYKDIEWVVRQLKDKIIC